MPHNTNRMVVISPAEIWFVTGKEEELLHDVTHHWWCIIQNTLINRNILVAATHVNMLFKRSLYPQYDLYWDYGVHVNIAIVCCITMMFFCKQYDLRVEKKICVHITEVEDQRKKRLNEWMNKPLPDYHLHRMTLPVTFFLLVQLCTL